MGKLHIVPHQHAIGKADRNKLNGHRSAIVWFVGLSGSGKSTLAGMLEQALHQQGVKTYLLDGDNVRTGLNKDLTFSAEDRQENIRRIAEVARLFAEAGMVALTAFISPFAKDRQFARELVEEGEYVEVFVDCPIEVCEERDVKGLYAKARAGVIKDFTGINSPFEAPERPEVRVETHKQSHEDALETVFSYVMERIRMA